MTAKKTVKPKKEKVALKYEKFTDKYEVETATIYKDVGMFAHLEIPPADHPLYDPTAPKTFDPIRVAAIDRDGKMTDPIEVWTDPDSRKLWVLDGRGRTLDVTEVNRRRAERKCELVKPYLVPFNGDEKAAIARLREKNYHRRVPKPSDMAMDLMIMRKAGHSWDACAAALHVTVEHTEAWGKKLLPLAFCIPEVRALFDEGKLPRSKIKLFAGAAADGSEAKGKKEQLALVAELLVEKQVGDKPKMVTPKKRAKVAAALLNGRSATLSHRDQDIAKAVAAALKFVDGDEGALGEWPDVAVIVKDALAKSKKGESEDESETEE